MLNNVVGVVMIVLLFASIWWSYKFFMRGSEPDKLALAKLPPDLKPDFLHVKFDNALAYESATQRVALVDDGYSKVVKLKEIVSVEAEDEQVAGVTHRWLNVTVKDAAYPRYRIWFQFNRAQRDAWRDRLAQPA